MTASEKKPFFHDLFMKQSVKFQSKNVNYLNFVNDALLSHIQEDVGTLS